MMDEVDERADQLAMQLPSNEHLMGEQLVVPRQQNECLIGVSANVAELKQFIAAQAPLHQPVLLIGEQGLRQEQIARALHQASERRAQPFFAVNAHRLSGDNLHNLLFGPRGIIQSGQRGTVYLNEFARLPALVQQRFGVYLEEHQPHLHADCRTGQRIIFATESEPDETSATGRLACGLIDLLRSATFRLKPLRERREDLPSLVAYLVEQLSARLNKGAYTIVPQAMEALKAYPWEGNIDELEAVLDSIIRYSPPHLIDVSLLPERISQATLLSIPPGGINLFQMVEDYERRLINLALKQTGGNQTQAARLLGLRAQTLNMKLKHYGAQRKTSKPG